MSYYLEIHNSTEHDGSIALNDDGKITIYSSERIDRKKHSNNFRMLKNFYLKHTGDKIEVHNSELRYTQWQSIHHHLAHGACSFFSSDYDQAAVLIVDGMGPYKDNLQASTSKRE